jgi:hypothetical protein
MKPREGKPKDNLAMTLRELEAFPFHCVNCSATFEDVKLFCSQLCADEAGWVRYVRGCRLDGRDQDPKVKEAIIIRLALILGGGYDKRARKLADSLRRSIFERYQGKCRVCGKPGEEIDHISGNSSDPTNLQLLCDPCHNKKTVSTFRYITKDSHPEEWAKAQWLKRRASAKLPMLICDSDGGMQSRKSSCGPARTFRQGRIACLGETSEYVVFTASPVKPP